MSKAGGRGRPASTKKTAEISVVMPVHNALPYLDEAVESILKQSFGNFEFVILDDASTDGSAERLRSWAARDPRIRLVEMKENLGPVLSSDQVARAARAPLVARMDADDLSHPERLALQYEVLRQHPEVGVVGCLSDMVDASGRKIRDSEPWRLARSSVMVPFAHGAMMYRRALFDSVGGYRPGCEYWEDQDLIVRMAEKSGVMVIPRTLFTVRQSATSTRVASEQDRLERAIDRMYGCIARMKGGEALGAATAGEGETAGKLDPRVFISIGSPALWAGQRPKLFRRFLKRAKLKPDLTTASAFAWTAWASLSPATLRGALRMLASIRNRSASASLRTDAPIAWTPATGRAAAALADRKAAR
jgi:glycosyltransferase involved in cell wall biosynthesis